MSEVPFPLAIATALLCIAVCVLSIVAIANAGTTKALAHRAFLQDTTPDHYRGRQADFDEFGRPW